MCIELARLWREATVNISASWISPRRHASLEFQYAQKLTISCHVLIFESLAQLTKATISAVSSTEANRKSTRGIQTDESMSTPLPDRVEWICTDPQSTPNGSRLQDDDQRNREFQINMACVQYSNARSFKYQELGITPMLTSQRMKQSYY